MKAGSTKMMVPGAKQAIDKSEIVDFIKSEIEAM